MFYISAFILLQGLLYFVYSILGIYLGTSATIGLMGSGFNFNYLGAILGICLITASVGLFQRRKYGYYAFKWTYSIFLIFEALVLISAWVTNGFDIGSSIASIILLGIFYKIFSFVGKERARFV